MPVEVYAGRGMEAREATSGRPVLAHGKRATPGPVLGWGSAQAVPKTGERSPVRLPHRNLADADDVCDPAEIEVADVAQEDHFALARRQTPEGCRDIRGKDPTQIVGLLAGIASPHFRGRCQGHTIVLSAVIGCAIARNGKQPTPK